jgi:hydroxypyruvate isomerase
MTDGLELAANISMLFTELPLLDRPAAVAAIGFQSTETWWPFGANPTPTPHEVDAFLGAIEESGIPLSGMNLYAGDLPGGERGIVSLPDRRDDFAAGLGIAVDIVSRTGCRGLNALYGQRIDGVSIEEQDGVAIENLASATRALAEVGAVVLIEALAGGLNGSYPLETAKQSIAVVERVREASGLDNIAFLFDTFHLASNGDDLIEVIRAHHDVIGHVQLADAPSRGEPGTGSVDFGAVLTELWLTGYRGVVAAEYRPSAQNTIETLGWIEATPNVALGAL